MENSLIVLPTCTCTIYLCQKRTRSWGANSCAQNTRDPLGRQKGGTVLCPIRGIAPACGLKLLFRPWTDPGAIYSQNVWRQSLILGWLDTQTGQTTSQRIGSYFQMRDYCWNYWRQMCFFYYLFFSLFWKLLRKLLRKLVMNIIWTKLFNSHPVFWSVDFRQFCEIA